MIKIMDIGGNICVISPEDGVAEAGGGIFHGGDGLAGEIVVAGIQHVGKSQKFFSRRDA